MTIERFRSGRMALWSLAVWLVFGVIFCVVAKGEPAPNPYGDRCVDPIWFLKRCDNQPIQLGTGGAGDDCAAHTLTIGAEITENKRLYAIVSQCPTDLDMPCRTFPKPEDSAGAAAIAVWERCFVPPAGCPSNEETIIGDDGVGYQTSRKPPESAGPNAIAHWNRCYLPRYRVDRACPGRNLPGGRQNITMYTLSAVPFPGPNPEAQRAAKAHSYGCDLGLPTSTPVPNVGTPTRVPTSAATRTRTPTRRPTGIVPCDTTVGGPICTPIPNRTPTAVPPTAGPTSTPVPPTPVPGPVVTLTMPRPSSTQSPRRTSTPLPEPSPTPISTTTPSPKPSKTPSGGGSGGSGCGGILGITVGTVIALGAVAKKRWTS